MTFQNVDNIKETESKIRRKLAEKGLTARYHFEDIIGESEELKQAVTMAYYYSRTDSNVLLLEKAGRERNYSPIVSTTPAAESISLLWR